MHNIIYKNVLENKEQQTDFIRWSKVHWPEQQRQGTTAVKLCNSWEAGDRILVCQYTMEESKQVMIDSVEPEFQKLLRSLNRIMHVRHTARHMRPLLRRIFIKRRSRRRRRRF